jgi:hypothetical protein
MGFRKFVGAHLVGKSLSVVLLNAEEARQPAIKQRRAVSPPGSQLRAALLHRQYKRARLDQYRDGIRVLPPEEQLPQREWAHWINNEFRSIIKAIACAAARWPHPEVKIALNEAMEISHRCAAPHSTLRMLCSR